MVQFPNVMHTQSFLVSVFVRWIVTVSMLASLPAIGDSSPAECFPKSTLGLMRILKQHIFIQRSNLSHGQLRFFSEIESYIWEFATTMPRCATVELKSDQ